MKIKFFCKVRHPKTKEEMLTLNDINGLSYAENVGWDMLASVNTGYNEDSNGDTILIWETYASKFKYIIKTTEEDGIFLVTYKGAFNGFLKQSLIPYFEVLGIKRVDSTILTLVESELRYNEYGIPLSVFMKTWGTFRNSLEWEGIEGVGIEAWNYHMNEWLDTIPPYISIKDDHIRPIPKDYYDLRYKFFRLLEKNLKRYIIQDFLNKGVKHLIFKKRDEDVYIYLFYDAEVNDCWLGIEEENLIEDEGYCKVFSERAYSDALGDFTKYYIRLNNNEKVYIEDLLDTIPDEYGKISVQRLDNEGHYLIGRNSHSLETFKE